MRARHLLVAVSLAVAGGAMPLGHAATLRAGAAPPAGSISSNVRYVTTLPEMASAISINFIGDTMYVSTVDGIYSYDVTHPESPTLLGALPQYIWEDEDVDVDPVRHLLFLSRDPRGFTSPATTAFPYGAIQTIDVSNPRAMTPVSVTLLPGGHTTTCVDHCRYVWTGGPATGVTQPSDWGGRPIFATDMRDPAHPVACPTPLDLGRNDGKTDYAHDVQVDSLGVAWVSGSGGIRGYWVSGRHRDPVTGRTSVADGCHPIPYAGGGTTLGDLVKSGGLMHNSWHDTSLAVDGRRGDVLLATEEVTVTDCTKSGRFATYDLRGSYHGEGFRNIAKTHFRMPQLATWTPEKQLGSTGCDSAHYFTDDGHGLLAIAFYTQGTRFLDVRDPRHIKQVAYFRPDDANTWAAYWHKGYVYIADFQRGIDVIQLAGKFSKPGGSWPAVSAPPKLTPVASTAVGVQPDKGWGWVCHVPAGALRPGVPVIAPPGITVDLRPAAMRRAFPVAPS